MEVIASKLLRIEQLNPKLNAYLTVAEAESAAKGAEAAVMKGEALPPLHGVPVSIKDLVFTKGIRTTGGSLVYRDWVPEEDAVAVQRLKRAGAIILGKTNTPEFGQSATTENRLGDHCHNPWNLERTTGGSSGGATAAVAAGIEPFALGSDGGGSIRIPSAFCGVYGIKPTFGRVPAHGCFGGMPLFSHLGPISRTVKDAALLLSVVSGFDRRDPTSMRDQPPDFLDGLEGEIRGLKVAWSMDLGYGVVDSQVASVFVSCLPVFESLGCLVEERTPEIEEPFSIFGLISLADAYAAFGQLLDEHASDLMPYVKSTLERGREVSGHEYSRTLRRLERFRVDMADLFQEFDLLLTPTTAVPAFLVGQRPRHIDGQPVSALWGPFPFTVGFNLTRQPAATVPCGFSADGLPIGLQIVGRFGDEPTVLRASAAFEKARPWKDKIPPAAAR